MSHGFPGQLRIKKSWEFRHIKKMGCKVATPHFILLKCSALDNFSRLGITASKKTGNAVCRNRSKRLIRQFFRTHRSRLDIYDYSIIVKRNISQLSSVEIFSELELIFTKN